MVMHPNGQLPAYEWAFVTINPPSTLGAAWRVYKIDAASVASAIAPSWKKFFTNCFSTSLGGSIAKIRRRGYLSGRFLGLDNIGVFDRSAPLRRAAISSNPTAPS